METRRQGITLFSAICALIGLLVILQLWLLSASLEAYLAHQPGAAWPAAIASAVLLGVNGALLAYVIGFDQRIVRARERRP